jgi:hypothetical protein
MTAEDRLAELSEALAIGYLRLLAKRKNPLDQRPESEAPCALVNGVEITPGKENA